MSHAKSKQHAGSVFRYTFLYTANIFQYLLCDEDKSLKGEISIKYNQTVLTFLQSIYGHGFMNQIVSIKLSMSVSE